MSCVTSNSSKASHYFSKPTVTQCLICTSYRNVTNLAILLSSSTHFLFFLLPYLFSFPFLQLMSLMYSSLLLCQQRNKSKFVTFRRSVPQAATGRFNPTQMVFAVWSVYMYTRALRNKPAVLNLRKCSPCRLGVGVGAMKPSATQQATTRPEWCDANILVDYQAATDDV